MWCGASDFRRGLERQLSFGAVPGYYEGIVRGSACLKQPKRCDLSAGIISDDATGTVTFHLAQADPDFLYKLALTFAAPAPPGTPDAAARAPAVWPTPAWQARTPPGTGDGRLALLAQGWRARMPEGLDPVEAGRKLDEQGPGEGERAADPAATKAAKRHSRIVQTGEALLLALVTIAAAWAGYAAAKWGTTSRVQIAQSSHLRSLASRADLEALSTRNFDSSTFSAWFAAYTLGSKQKQAIAERRFRPLFRTAFNAWMATDPLHNPHAAPGPTYMPQYKLPEQAQANRLDRAAAAKFSEGTHAGEISDNYIRITVFLAAVLFLIGIGSTFRLHQIRYALITFGTVLLVLAVVLIFHEPGVPS